MRRISIGPSAVLAVTLLASTAAVAADPAPPALAGVWQTDAYSPRLKPADGKPIPFTAAGRALYAKTAAGLKSRAIVDLAVELCVPEGMPRALTSPYPFQIMMTPGQVTFAHEANRAYRIVALSDRRQDPAVWDPSYMGDGIGKWDGETLIIDSTNFKADKIFLDASGLPASEQLRLTERLRLQDHGQKLEDRITIQDPAVFAQPWTVSLTFRRRDDLELRTDWVCGEKHRDVSAVVRGKAK